MNPIDALFGRLRVAGRKALIPFVTAGDPDLRTTEQVVRELARNGASLVEIGFPYSDPLADGPVIQASYTRALGAGVRVDDILACVRTLTSEGGAGVPLVGMLSYSLIHRRGSRAFVEQSARAGLSGLIVPDLPLEEASSLARTAAYAGLKLIQLVTPTTSRERAIDIARSSTGFLYYVTITGITGERDRLPDELSGELKWLRSQTDLPVCVGFGISKPEHVYALRDVADGVIVGSAFVRRLEEVDKRPLAGILSDLGSLAARLDQALNP
jgi:tryptophan synthase alpha chain